MATVKPIAKSYWRLIKAGTKTYASVPATVQSDVLTLGIEDADAKIITKAEFKAIFGISYTEATEK